MVPTFCHGVDRRRRFLSWLLALVSPFAAYTKLTPESLRDLVGGAGFTVEEPLVFPGTFPIVFVCGDRP